MAPTPRRRYSHIPVGLFELLSLSISKSRPNALLFLAWLYVSPLRRAIPGLVIASPVALADAIGWGTAATKRCISELEKADIVTVDGERRNIVWIRRAIADDAPKNGNVLQAWAAQLEELPPCAVVADIVDAVEGAVVELDQAAVLVTKWRQLTGSILNRYRNSSANRLANSSKPGLGNSRGTPLPTPITNSGTASDTASAAESISDADSTSRRRLTEQLAAGRVHGQLGKGFPNVGSGPYGRR